MSGKTYEVITDLFRGNQNHLCSTFGSFRLLCRFDFDDLYGYISAVTGRKPIAPKDFVGHSGTPAITCSHKAASGFLYPLDKGMIYIYKPPIYLR